MNHFKSLIEAHRILGFPPPENSLISVMTCDTTTFENDISYTCDFYLIMELIHLFLISEAKNLLIGTSYSVSEIAYKLGFDNPPYFSRLFKKETGISPSEFKHQGIK